MDTMAGSISRIPSSHFANGARGQPEFLEEIGQLREVVVVVV